MTNIPFKLKALRGLTATLKSINIADGYTFDLGDFTDHGRTKERVFRGRTWFGDNDPIPMLSILEGIHPAAEVDEPPVDTTSGEYDWQLLIQGFVNDDPLHPTDPGYFLLADVRRRLAAERLRKLPGSRSQPDPFGLGVGRNRVMDLGIGPGVVRPADDVSAKAYFWLSITVRVFEDAADPFS